MNPLPNLRFSGTCLYRTFLSLCVHLWLKISPPIFQALNWEKICILYSDKYSIFVVACLNSSCFSWFLNFMTEIGFFYIMKYVQGSCGAHLYILGSKQMGHEADKLITYFSVMLRLRMHGAVPPLSSWHGAYLSTQSTSLFIFTLYEKRKWSILPCA